LAWAWHDHKRASRIAHGAAYATYMGSWRKRFCIMAGENITPLFYETRALAAYGEHSPRFFSGPYRPPFDRYRLSFLYASTGTAHAARVNGSAP
jgi:hypothetical protein